MERDGHYVMLWLPAEFDELMRDTPGRPMEITDGGRAAFVSGMLMALADVMGYPAIRDKLTAHATEQNST